MDGALDTFDVNERQELRALLERFWKGIRSEAPPDFWVRRSPHAEYSCNIALVAAGLPNEVARELKKFITESGAWPGRVEELRGFLNFHLDDEELKKRVEQALREGARYGAGETMDGARINVEFVSAEPTGPLSLDAGRIAVAGEALCRLLEWQGANVTREFFLNDAETSSKMRLLGESVEYYYLDHFEHEANAPESVMSAAWVQNVARSIVEREGNAYLLVPASERVAEFARQACAAAVSEQKATLARLGVHFDVWASENALRREGRVENALARLRERGYLDERDGALWLRSTAFGDDADRPLVRANGEPTYLAADLAYHIFIFERGFDTIINIWSAPHKTYVARTHAALQAAGYETENKLEVLTCADASIMRDGATSGRELTLDEELQEIEPDALRFECLLHPWDEAAAIELELARRDDEKNPAYAARLLPTRLKTMIGAAGEGESPAEQYSEAARALAKLVALWPDEAESAAKERAPWLVARFVLEMAEAARALLEANEGPDVSLLRAAQITANNALRLLGMDARNNF